MYKTIWMIYDIESETETEFTYYHFGKNPQFPTWYMEENHVYEIEMFWHFKLIYTFEMFFKCLTHYYIIK